MAARKTKTVVEEPIIQEDSTVEENATVEATPAKKKAEKVKHDPDELIACRSVTFGELLLVGPKTGMQYSWSNEGDIREVEYQDLISLKAIRSSFIFKPYFVIEDEDIVNEWSRDLSDLYNRIGQIDIRDMFNLPQRQFVTQLKALPAAQKEAVQNTAYSMLQDGTLYDIRKIKAIDEILGTELISMIG